MNENFRVFYFFQVLTDIVSLPQLDLTIDFEKSYKLLVSSQKKVENLSVERKVLYLIIKLIVVFC